MEASKLRIVWLIRETNKVGSLSPRLRRNWPLKVTSELAVMAGC